MAAAHKGAAVLQAHLGKLSRIDKKGAIDLVTEADLGSEKAIIDTIRGAFPDHAILAEESGARQGDDDCQWIIDPLDGTTNYAHGLELFAVSIAFARQGEPVFGIVLNPATNELFSAAKGQGARLNGRPITVDGTDRVSDSLLVTGFPYNFATVLQPLLMRFSNCLQAARAVRRLGSAALDLCYVANGRFAGYWEQNLQPWDTAAGLVIAREAGAVVTDFENQTYQINSNQILATNGKVHQEMLNLLRVEEDT